MSNGRRTTSVKICHAGGVTTSRLMDADDANDLLLQLLDQVENDSPFVRVELEYPVRALWVRAGSVHSVELYTAPSTP